MLLICNDKHDRYGEFRKYLQRSTCYFTALFQNGFNLFFYLKILHTVSHNDEVKNFIF